MRDRGPEMDRSWFATTPALSAWGPGRLFRMPIVARALPTIRSDFPND
jgi:hypothetical protein